MKPYLFILPSLAFIACSSSEVEPGGPDAPTQPRPDSPATGAADAPTEDLLSQAGLYSNFAARTIDPSLKNYTPLYTLWADSLEKHRYVGLPPGTQINTDDMDHWVFPVGTRFWKEFAKTDGTPIETRIIEKTSDSTWRMGSFVWRNDSSDAVYTENGAANVHGTDWNVPSLDMCQRCHDGQLDKFLGYEAIQLGDSEVAKLAQANLLTTPPAEGQSFALPWDDKTNGAFGMFYGNCGHCHNPDGNASNTGMFLRLKVSDLGLEDPANTDIFKTTVNVKTTIFMTTQDNLRRVVPHNTGLSAIHIRMSSRDLQVQMPPIATKHVDTVGVGLVDAWINSL